MYPVYVQVLSTIFVRFDRYFTVNSVLCGTAFCLLESITLELYEFEERGEKSVRTARRIYVGPGRICAGGHGEEP